MEDTILHVHTRCTFRQSKALLFLMVGTFANVLVNMEFLHYANDIALRKAHVKDGTSKTGSVTFSQKLCYIKSCPGYPVFMFGNSNVSGYRCKVTAKEILEMKNKLRKGKTVVHGPRCRSS